MANRDWPHGFIPVGSQTGGEAGYIRNYNKVVGMSTAIGRFDLVDPQASGVDVAQAAAGGPYLGVSLNYGAASSATTHNVLILRPDSIIEGQTDGSLATADANLNANFVVAAASTTTGLSQMEINAATEDTTSTLDLHLLRLAPYIDNVTGTNSRWFCVPNRLYFVSQASPAGV